MRFARAVATTVVTAVLAVALLAPTASARPAQTAPAAPPEITAIISPIAAPACNAAGTATLLVPILGGVVQDTLSLGKTVNLGDVVLDAVGPVYIVCGALPSSPGSHCNLDDQIAGVWPAQLGGAGVAAPVILGNVVDAIAAIAKAAGLPAELSGAQVLQCAVPDAAGAVQAPPAAPPATSRPAAPAGDSTTTAVAGTSGTGGGSAAGRTGSSGGTPAGASGTAAGPTTKPSTGVAAVLDSITHRVPGGILFLQLLLAILLVVFLGGSWIGSWRTAKHAGGDQPLP